MIRTFAVRSALTVGLAAGLAVGLVGVSGVAGAATHGPKVPGKPTTVSVTPSNTALAVSWGVPTTDGGASISGYTATATSAGLATQTCTTAGALKCVITGIVNPVGKAKNMYKVAVTATNSVGTGKAGKASGTYTGTTSQNCSYLGEYANLQGCDLSNANLAGFDLSNSNLVNTILYNANLPGVNFTNSNLSGADVRYDNITMANFYNAYLANADFEGSNLTGANLGYDNITGATFTNALLTNVSMDGSNLSNANLSNADLSGAYLRNVNFTGANVTGVTYSGSTTCPNTINYGTAGANCP